MAMHGLTMILNKLCHNVGALNDQMSAVLGTMCLDTVLLLCNESCWKKTADKENTNSKITPYMHSNKRV